MCNNMQAVHQISLLPEYVTRRTDFGELASVCTVFKSLVLSPGSALEESDQ